MNFRHAGLVLICWLPCAGAQAQDAGDTLTIGAHVQVHGVMATPGGDHAYYLSGTVAGRDDRHLFVANPAGTRVDTLPYFAMSQLSVSRGFVPRKQMMLDGLLAGTAAGLGVYAFMTVAEEADRASVGPEMDRLGHRAIPALAVAGFALGSVLGNELWVSVRIPGAFDLPKR